MPKMIRLAALTLLSTSLSLLPALARAADAPTDKPEKPDHSSPDAPLPSAAELAKQRVESAAKAMKMAEQLFRMGQGSIDELQTWTQRWLQARLDAARGREERIAILKEYVDLAKAREQLAQKRVQAGLISPLETEAARYFRLDAELRLARRMAQADDGGAEGGGRRGGGRGGNAERSDSPNSAATKDEQALQGKWKVVRKMKNGAPEDEGETIYLTFNGKTVTQTRGEGKNEGKFALDASKTPKHITLTGTKGEKAGTTFEAIYELDGKTLKLAYSTGDNAGTPPKDFAGADGCGLLVLERQAGDRGTDRKE